jgi:hypothetical protein
LNGQTHGEVSVERLPSIGNLFRARLLQAFQPSGR